MHEPTSRPTTLLLAVLFVALTGACGQVTDNASDCLPDQYFDQYNELCRTCVPAQLPVCPLDCGAVLTTNSLGCQVAECACGTCDEGDYYNRDLLECTACPPAESAECRDGCPVVGETVDEFGCSQAVCQCEEDPCPPVPPLDCGPEGCCEATLSAGAHGCPVAECQCPAEAPAGTYFDEAGACHSCAETEAPVSACETE